MKILHLKFHHGCELEIEYVFKKLGHDISSMTFDNDYNDINEITYKRAQNCWEKNKDYFDTFDGIVTSYPCSSSRTFLQNNWSKLLIIWVTFLLLRY